MNGHKKNNDYCSPANFYGATPPPNQCYDRVGLRDPTPIIKKNK